MQNGFQGQGIGRGGMENSGMAGKWVIWLRRYIWFSVTESHPLLTIVRVEKLAGKTGECGAAKVDLSWILC